MKDDNDILKAVFSQLGDSYEYLKALGEGATSKVYLVYHKHFKQYRALKIMDYDFIRKSMVKGNISDSIEEFKRRRKRFINEAKVYKKTKHPNIAEIYDIRLVNTQTEDIEIPYIIMQYVEGEPLSKLLKNKKPLKLEMAAAISVNILDALEAIHQKSIIHRDIKPSNIMIEKGTGKAILIDFGLAKDMIEGTHMTSTGLPMGTKLYMSPEQFKDSSKVGPETDIYSFGVILYEMLTGKPPYEGNEAGLMFNHIYGEIPDINKDNKYLPGVMDTLIRKAMGKEEKNRENAQYYKEKLAVFIKKTGSVEVKAVKIRKLFFKSGGFTKKTEPEVIKADKIREPVFKSEVITKKTEPEKIKADKIKEPIFKSEVIIKKAEPEVIKADKIREPVFKSGAIIKGFAYAAVFIFIEAIFYYLYFNLSPTSIEIVKGREILPIATSPSPGDARNEPKGDGTQSETGVKTADTGAAQNEASNKVSKDTSSKPQNAPLESGPVGDKKESKSVGNQSDIGGDIETGAAPLDLPDPDYYGLNRDGLLECAKTQMKTFPISWIAACAREGIIIYKDASLTGTGFQAAYLQRFAVLDKNGDKLKLKELGKTNPVMGWASMKNLIYLPCALKDEQMSVYQKVVFSHVEDQLEPGEIGDITFYKTPDSNNQKNILETRAMGTLRIAYVYAWENNDYEDSQWVLIGDYPSMELVFKDENAFKKTLYGWCETSKLFPWNSRMALIPNKEKNTNAYIFTNGSDLTNFYMRASATSIPEPEDLLTADSYKMWKDSNWPFFLGKKLNENNPEFLRLVCRVDARQANISRFPRVLDERREKRTYIMTLGYAVEKDPNSKLNQFKNVYLFRKSEIINIMKCLERTLVLLKPRTIKNLWKKLIEQVYGEEYDSIRNINQYAQMRDGITYKELSILFDKTQEQIDNLGSNEINEIGDKISAVRERLEDILNDKVNERFFGTLDDPYIWLYEEELP